VTLYETESVTGAPYNIKVTVCHTAGSEREGVTDEHSGESKEEEVIDEGIGE